MNRDTDQSLIERTNHGDLHAYGVLVERYQDFIFTIIYRMVKVREEAEEISQDVFLKAYESLPGFRGESKFSSWLYRIAYRKALDSIRKNSRMLSLEYIDESAGIDVDHLETGLDLMLQEERSKIINRCILELPAPEAAIIGLFYFEEQSLKEIARVTELSEANVKIKLYRSRKLLFSLLKEYIHPDLQEKNEKESYRRIDDAKAVDGRGPGEALSGLFS